METLEVGEAHSGAHVCALYAGPDERDRLLVPYLQEGLRHGEACVSFIDDLEPSSMRRGAYGPAGPGDSHRPGHIGFYPASDVCPRIGELSADKAITLLATLASSTDDGFPTLRAAAEMSWLHQPEAQELVDYESAVNEVLAELPALFLCMYDLERLGVGMLVDVLRMHSKVLLHGAVLDNPHCLGPCDFSTPTPTPDTVSRFPLAKLRTGRVDGGDEWLSLTGAEVRVAELVAGGMTNRETAEELVVSPHTVDAHLKHMYVKLGIHSRVELTVLALQHGAPAA